MAPAQMLSTDLIRNDLDRWFIEDGFENGDVTSEVTIARSERASLRLVAREAMVACGVEPMARGIEAFDIGITLVPTVAEGQAVSVGDEMGLLRGDLRGILSFERTLLNVIGHVSGVATTTRQFVEAIAGTSAVITDTRKTTPGLRKWEKYAVVCGGGTSHREALDDAALFKDNHFIGLSPTEMGEALVIAIGRARADRDLSFVEVEVDTLAQCDVVLQLDGVDIILLDNMPPDMMREAVSRRDALGSNMMLEASGGITLETVRAAAETGVDRIAVGAVTRDARILDIGLDA